MRICDNSGQDDYQNLQPTTCVTHLLAFGQHLKQATHEPRRGVNQRSVEIKSFIAVKNNIHCQGQWINTKWIHNSFKLYCHFQLPLQISGVVTGTGSLSPKCTSQVQWMSPLKFLCTKYYLMQWLSFNIDESAGRISCSSHIEEVVPLLGTQ